MTNQKAKGTDDYYALIQTGKVEEIAAALKEISDRQLCSILQNLSKGWKGENALAYLSKGAKIQDRISTSADHLYQIAEDMQEVVKKDYAASKENR